MNEVTCISSLGTYESCFRIYCYVSMPTASATTKAVNYVTEVKCSTPYCSKKGHNISPSLKPRPRAPSICHLHSGGRAWEWNEATVTPHKHWVYNLPQIVFTCKCSVNKLHTCRTKVQSVMKTDILLQCHVML